MIQVLDPGLIRIEARNSHQFHPDVPLPDLRCDPFLLGLSDWLDQIDQRVFDLKMKVHRIRFPVRPLPPKPPKPSGPRLCTVDDL